MPVSPYNRGVQPPSSPLALGEPLYEAFYGLREQPFALSTDPRFLYLSPSHRRAYEELLTGLRRREGILLLTGETGTGKTTLCRALIDALGHRTFSALILNPYMSSTEVLRVILRDLGLVSRDDIRHGAFAKADTPQLLDTLESFLRSLLPLNSYAVVIIDEAQSLAPQVLDEVRMLGGYEQDGHRLLQIVLVGQPAIAQTLATDPMRALNERISRRAQLEPLTLDEVGQYIDHRLSVAGGKQHTVRFLPDAVGLITDLSRGLPRRVNLICDRALEEGRVTGTSGIGPDLVKRAARAVAGVPQPAEENAADIELASSEPRSSTPDRELTFSMAPAASKRGRFWLWLVVGLVLAAGASVGGVYDWQMASRVIALPTPASKPALKLGDGPLVPTLPTDDELKVELQAMGKAPAAP